MTASGVAGVALAAGAGTRLRPLTLDLPKPLCPVGDRALVDWSLDALMAVTPDVAVNVHHGRDALTAHLARRPTVHVSVEEREALGTAGAVGRLRDWLAGRAALVANADTWHRADLRPFVEGWDGARVSVLTSSPLPFGPGSAVVASLLPWSVASTLAPVPSGLWESVWRDQLGAGRLEARFVEVEVVDCGTPSDYLRANMTWSGGWSVVGEGAEVLGTVERSVVWPGARVRPTERLVDAIRTPNRTVLVR